MKAEGGALLHRNRAGEIVDRSARRAEQQHFCSRAEGVEEFASFVKTNRSGCRADGECHVTCSFPDSMPETSGTVTHRHRESGKSSTTSMSQRKDAKTQSSFGSNTFDVSTRRLRSTPRRRAAEVRWVVPPKKVDVSRLAGDAALDSDSGFLRQHPELRATPRRRGAEIGSVPLKKRRCLAASRRHDVGFRQRIPASTRMRKRLFRA